MEKTQLNLLVELSINDKYRQLAMEAGYGSRHSNLLGTLIAMYEPDLPRLYARMVQVFQDPSRELTREERFYAEQLRDLFDSLIDK